MKRLALLAALLAAPLVALADVAGTWTATFTTQIGEQSYTYVFAVYGTTLTGTAKNSMNEMPTEIKDGKSIKSTSYGSSAEVMRAFEIPMPGKPGDKKPDGKPGDKKPPVKSEGKGAPPK